MVKDLGLDAVDSRQIGVEDHAFAADRVDDAIDQDGRDGFRGGRFAGARHGERGGLRR